jgi:hypothetical protein
MSLMARGAVLLLTIGVARATIPTGGYASFLGGRTAGYGSEHVFSVSVDAEGNLFAAGYTDSSIPEPARRYGHGNVERGGFVTKINPAGTQRLFTTFFERIDLVALKLAANGDIFALGHISEPREFVNLGTYAGGFQDAVLLKLDSAGALLWGRYFGGSDLELPRALAIDSAGHAYIAGYTSSIDLPTTPGALQRASAGGFDGFVAKFNGTGELIYATYLGGPSSESVTALVVDSQGRAVVAGGSLSSSLAGFQAPRQFGPGGGTDAFICRLNAQGAGLDWLSRIGGGSRDSALALSFAPNGGLAILGITESENFPTAGTPVQAELLGSSDLFVALLSADGQTLSASIYLGGSEAENLGDPFYVRYTLDGETEERILFPEAAGIAVSALGEIHIAARTSSDDWPAAAEIARSFAANRDGYYARLSPDLGELREFEFFGGAGDDEFRTIALDASGNRYLGGTTYAPFLAPFFPVSPNAFQWTYGGGAMDGVVVKIPTNASAPGNDAFANREQIAGERASIIRTIDSATLESGEPGHEPGVAKTLWFSWTAPNAGRLIVSPRASSFPATVAAYAGTSLQSLTLLAKTNDAQMRFAVAAGQEYFLVIAGDNSATGLARMTIEFSQPPNDDFEDATVLSGFPVSAEGSNVNSTVQEGEPAHADHIPGRTVWWRWTAPVSASVAVSSAETEFDTVLAIYRGTALESLEVVVSNDNVSDADRTSEAVFQAVAGQIYQIAVAGPPDEFGAIRLRIVSNTPPANDDFALAATISGYAAQITASSIRATLEAGEPTLTFTNALGEVDAGFGRATVWWSWIAPEEGRVRIDTVGSDFNTRLGVYTGTTLGTLQLVTVNDDINRAANQRTSRVDFDVQASRQYWIQVDGTTGEAAGVIKLSLRLSFPPRILTPTLERTAEGNLRFQAEGVPGVGYRYQTSQDLRTWTDGPQVVTEANGVWEFTVPAGGAPRLFVRLAGPDE